MSDLVAQLRDQAKKLGEGPRGIAWGHSMLMTEAADEIERLRHIEENPSINQWHEIEKQIAAQPESKK